jgi:hypothetical protein
MAVRAYLAACLLTAALPARAAITGTVVGPDGRAAAGVRVAAFAVEAREETRARWFSAEPARKPLAAGVADAKGGFALDVKAPVADLRFEADGQGAVGERAAANDDAGVIVAGGIPMARGRISAGGKALAGATVIVLAAGAESVTVTDASGTYALPDPKRLPSRVIVRHPDYAPVELELSPIRPAKADVAMTPGVALMGRVVGPDGKSPVAGVTVLVDNLPLATTGADGAFSIPHAPASRRKVVARAGNRLAIVAGASDLRLATAASITGTVRDGKGVPVAGVEVIAAAPRFAGTDPGGSAVTDAKGSYSIGGLAGGEYELTAVHPGYAVPALTLNLPAGGAARRALVATPFGRIAGSVLDEDRRGLAGARVSVRIVGGGDRAALPGVYPAARAAITAPNGRFLLRTAEEGNVQVDAAKKGLPAAHSGTLRLAAGERKSGIEIIVPRGVVLSGRVTGRDTDRSLKPVAGAAVSVAEPGKASDARRTLLNSEQRGSDDLVQTDAAGLFTMKVPEGTYDVLVTAAGFAPKTVAAQHVTAGTPVLEIVLDPGVEVSGRVTRGGTPVEGVNVFTVGGDVAAPVQTGVDGTFRLVDLAPGPVVLAFRKVGDFVQTTRSVTAPARGVDVDLPAGGRVSGQVVDKATLRPVKAFDAGIALTRAGGVTVPPVMHSFTADDGTFVIDGVPAGSQTVVVSAPGYVMARLPNVKVESGKSVENLAIALERGVRVTGHVTGPDNSPVGGALVRVDPSAGGRPRGTDTPYTLTDGDGAYVLENVDAGETTLVFSKSGLLPLQKNVTLSGAEAEVDARLAAGASISGIVVTEGGAPVGDAQVRASSAADPGFGRSTQTESGGTFTIAGVAPGHYEVAASKSGYADAIARDVDIAAVPSVRLVLKAGATIVGRLTGLTAAELRGATVLASSPDGSATATPDAAGSYRIDGAPAGSVRVSARAGQLATSSRSAPAKSVQLEPGGTVTVDFDFAADIVVGGRITRSGTPFPGAMVSFTPAAGALRSARSAADGGGRYEITGIDAGSYTVTVHDAERGPYSTPYEVRGSATFDIDIRGAALAGRVTDASTGAAIADAVVEVRRKDAGPALPRSAASGPDGAFSFEQLPPAEYELRAQASGYGAATLAITVGESAPPPLEVKLSRTSGLMLKLVDARDGRALNGWAHASSSGNGGGGGGYDGPAGSAPLPLAPGSYRVTAGAPAYASRTLVLTAPGEQTMALTPGGTIVVTSSNGSPAQLRLLDASGEPYRLGPGPVAGILPLAPAPGETRIPNVAAGSYTLQLLDTRGQVVRTTGVVVGEGQVAGVKW